jgi:hypothetical protein
VAGEMLVGEFELLLESRHDMHTLIPVLWAALVLVAGKLLVLRHAAGEPAIDLLDASVVHKNRAKE